MINSTENNEFYQQIGCLHFFFSLQPFSQQKKTKTCKLNKFELIHTQARTYARKTTSMHPRSPHRRHVLIIRKLALTEQNTMVYVQAINNMEKCISKLSN